MLELAELLGKTLKPQRTVIFIAFTCEESGLLGSKYYVKNMKRFPAKKVIGVINFDTVGRLWGKKLLVLSSNSAREWKFIFMGAGYVTGVESEMVTQDLDASDQRSFIEAGVPGVQIFSGANEDYHKPTDTPDKIDAAGMVKVATFAREGILYLADRIEPLTFQGQTTSEKPKTESQSGERKVSTGSMPDFAYSGEGVRIADLTAGSPAEKAGLQKGDIIIQLGQYKVKNLREYSDALKKFNPGDVVDLHYLRDGKENQTKIELTAK
jgi:aminopeptidase N